MSIKKSVKHLAALALLAIMLLEMLPAAFAENEVRIIIDGAVQVFSDTDGSILAPIIRDGTTYLPVRAVGQAVDRSIEWEGDTNTVYIGRKGAAKPTADVKVYVDGAPLDPRDANGKSAPPFILGGRTYLPVRAVGEAFGLKVGWDGVTRSVILTSEKNDDPDVYRLIFIGDWDGLKGIDVAAYQKNIVREFTNFYPKLLARWGSNGTEAKTVFMRAEKDSDYYDTDIVASTVGGTGTVVISNEAIMEAPDNFEVYVHEFTHIMQSYPYFDDKWVQDGWWTEHMADYAQYRYFTPTASGRKVPYDLSADDPEVHDWGWGENPYGPCEWFFAYMDSRYPTRKLPDGSISLGLIDTINASLKNGKLSGDGGSNHDNEEFNAIVKSITGYGSMELLRQRYSKELTAGTWRFEGFDDYEDNFLTENIPAKIEVLWADENLLLNAGVHDFRGYDLKSTKPSMLADGSIETGWQCGPTEDEPYVVFDLGEKKTFNSYTLAGYSDPKIISNTGTWELLVSDDGETWRSADFRYNSKRSVVSYGFDKVSARYVMLKVIAPAEGGKYVTASELMLFYIP